ncbi:hypothetical protein [Pollutibacter soli]|uniref:hypothetical protein n=1 Tax=Pollutibacter soli TaxID=3034157 RepID=UPI003013B6F3
MKYLVALVCLIIFTFSCAKESEIPEELPYAIKAYTEGNSNCGCEPFVDLYSWNKQFVYLIFCKGPACNCAPVYYNEAGELLTMADGYSFDQFRDDAKFEKNVWNCNNRPQ